MATAETRLHPAVVKYRKDSRFITSLTAEDLRIIAAVPAYREHVVPTLALMIERHGIGDYNPAKDSQDAENIMYFTSADAIRRCLSRARGTGRGEVK